MASNTTNLGSLAPIHTDFGNNSSDLLVVEYDVPQTKIKKTLFYKYGQLSIPKWALIPIGIAGFGLLTALCAIILNSILSQSSSSATYSQVCSKTSKCKTDFGLVCGSQSKCACPSKQYWYEGRCVNQPTYTEQCNQTTECRTDLGLVCAEIEGQCNCPNITIVQTCDCPSTSYWTGSTCNSRSDYLGVCSIANISYQCISNLYCDGSKCTCAPNSQYWNFTASQCYSIDKYHALCNQSTSYSCDASASLSCLFAGDGSQCPFNATAGTTSCECANGTYWNGGSCVAEKTINAPCFWSCECNSALGLQCLNMTCVCPKKNHWSPISSSCQAQLNYTQTPCLNTSECDTTQGLTCSLSGSGCNCPNTSISNMCDCLSTQYYDYNLTSCQTSHLYNDTCTANYMCDSTLGLFCQTTNTSATNCSCPEPIRLYMCDCNMTSYWNGIACVSRLAPNISCSYSYQCQANFVCIVNETDIGVFSDVCRCPLGSYYINGSGCVASLNYTQICIGSYQCYEPAPLSCRYNDTGLTCLDTNTYSLPACDCEDYYYFNAGTSTCLPLLNRLNSCNDSCQCNSPYQCKSGKCDCGNFYSSLTQACVQYLTYGDQCSNTAQCNATPNALLTCNGTCGCGTAGYWTGSQCQTSTNFRSVCTNDNNCFSGLQCKNIPCAGPSKRCSCPDNNYYSPTNLSCTACTGPVSGSGGYKRFVINYPTSDLCIAALFPPGSSSSNIPFSTAVSQCNSLTSMFSGGTPRLLSVHNQTELNCIGAVLQPAKSDRKCSKNFYYIGYSYQNMTFFDGTSYISAFSSPSIILGDCLTYCYNDDTTGTLSFQYCSDSSTGNTYGAICDYHIF